MNIKRLLDEKAREFSPLLARMDADKNQIYGTGYELKDAHGNRARGVYHVNLLDARHFVAKAKAKLCGVNRQTLVTASDLDLRNCELIEHFLEDLQFEVDDRLSRQGEADSFSQHAELICVRGRIAEQVLLRLEGDTLVPDIRPLDCRYLLYEADADGIRWAAPFFTRSAADIEAEYGVVTPGPTAVVHDYWDNRQEVVLIDGREVSTRPNPYGYPPFIIVVGANTSSLRDADANKHRGDSILHLCRTDDGKYLFEERNFYASILKSQTSETLKPPMQKPPKPDGSLAEPAEGYPGPGEIISTDSRYELIPKPDVRQSTQLYAGIIDRLLDRATFGDLENGVITLPLSAVAINRLLTAQNEGLLPCLNSLARLCQASARMRLRQFREINRAQPALSFLLGEPGKRGSYKAVSTEGEFLVRYRFFITSQEQVAGATAVANALGDLVSEHYKISEILNLTNPDEILAERDAERARRLNPAVLLYDEIMALITQRDGEDDIEHKEELDTKARLQLAEMITILRQRRAAKTMPLNPANAMPAAGRQIMPVFNTASKEEK